MVLLVVYFIVYQHYSFLEHAKNEVHQRLKAISCTASLQIDAEKLLQLQKEAPDRDDILTNEQHPIYQELHLFLKKIHLVNKLESPIYIMVFNNSTEKFQFLATSSDRPYYRHDYELFPSELLDNYETGGVLDVYDDENGSWLSAYAPVKDLNGNPVALIQADERFDDFLDRASDGLINNVLIALVILVPSLLLLYSLVNKMLMNEEESKQFLKEKNEEIRVQNELIIQNSNRLEDAKRIIEVRNRDLDLQVRKRTHELLKANRDLETFLYRSSHDVQGPLATLKGLCYVAEKDMTTKNAAHFVQMMSQSTHKLSTVINGIEEVYHIKTRNLRKETFNLKAVIEKIKQDHLSDITKSSINFQFEQRDTIELNTDIDMFILVVNELIENAIQYGVTDANPQIIVRAFKQGKILHFSVSDNGGNIDVSMKNSIAKIFTKGVITSMDQGFGLYVVYLAVKRLNGTIRLNTDNPPITRFELSFDNF